ncbi:hypothetical protein [Micromonospora sp. LH3U1]|uniref:hypothetical protein n=1 Tax=Micromonospora sp. LH3U1 TaxID=3018339 RepID=UPI00234BBA65|nr:hypothetical protein [Micromonospora sp. LH3U1]WCN83504.1 hypothetical protein PCA76_10820 [Micromonospora sp. LH3U1]
MPSTIARRLACSTRSPAKPIVAGTASRLSSASSTSRLRATLQLAPSNAVPAASGSRATAMVSGRTAADTSSASRTAVLVRAAPESARVRASCGRISVAAVDNTRFTGPSRVRPALSAPTTAVPATSATAVSASCADPVVNRNCVPNPAATRVSARPTRQPGSSSYRHRAATTRPISPPPTAHRAKTYGASSSPSRPASAAQPVSAAQVISWAIAPEGAPMPTAIALT